MSQTYIPLGTIFYGDVTLERGTDTTIYGFGDLRTNRNIIIEGTEDSNGQNSIGCLLINGGTRIGKSLHVMKDLKVHSPGITYLDNTVISNQNANLTVSQNSIILQTNTNGSINIGAQDFQNWTTINGNLYLSRRKENVADYYQQIVKIDDNIITLNNSPFTTSDGGYAVKRYQIPFDNTENIGDIANGLPTETGIIGVNNSNTTIELSGGKIIENYYKNWWVKIPPTSNINNYMQMRKIKSYNSTTKIATIYDDNDKTNGISEGKHFSAIPNNTNVYFLYSDIYVMNIWDESSKEFALIYSDSVPENTSGNLQNRTDLEPNILRYCDLRINELNSNEINTTNMNVDKMNDSFADKVQQITLTHSNGTKNEVEIDLDNYLFSGELTKNYGVYYIIVRPEANFSYRTHAVFMIARINDIQYPGSVNRLVSVKGRDNEQLEIIWRANSKPVLTYKVAPSIENSITTYYVKIITV